MKPRSGGGAGPRRRVRLERPVAGASPVPRVPDAFRRTLDNGLRIVAVPHTQLPQIAFRLLIPAGSVSEPQAFPGTAALVGDLLTEGTDASSAQQLNERLDGLGASLRVHVTHDFAEVELFLLSETVAEALPLLGEIVTRPAFPAREVERIRREALDSLEARHDEPANVADDLLAEAIFGREHPYGRLSEGTAEGLAALDVESLHSFHAARYRPEGSTLVVAGDLAPDAIATELESVFASWSGRAEAAPPPPPPRRARLAGERVHVSRPEAPQAEIRFGAVGMQRSSPDWIPAAVANYILGGSTTTSRLGMNLREDKGWTYGVRSGFSAAEQPGGWVIETAVDIAVTDAATAEIRAEITRFADAGPAAAELRRAQEALVLSLPRAFETPERIVNRLATLEAFGLREDYWSDFPRAVRAVEEAEVVRVVRRYMEVGGLAEVVVS